MASIRVPNTPTQRQTPAFVITELDGEYEATEAKMVPYGAKDRDGRQKHRLEYETVKRPKGYLISTPKNGSVQVPTLDDVRKQLVKQGFSPDEIPFVDDDGEPVGSQPLRIQKAKKEAMTNA